MTPERQRIVIAEACGWTQCQPRASVTDTPWISGINPEPAKIVAVVERDGTHRAARESDYGFETLPDYPNDLNAMHDAERVLLPLHWPAYLSYLSARTGDGTLHTEKRLCHAAAARRAEAFLRTLNLWENES